MPNNYAEVKIMLADYFPGNFQPELIEGLIKTKINYETNQLIIIFEYNKSLSIKN